MKKHNGVGVACEVSPCRSAPARTRQADSLVYLGWILNADILRHHLPQGRVDGDQAECDGDQAELPDEAAELPWRPPGRYRPAPTAATAMCLLQDMGLERPAIG